ncbi:BTAD domain-containing putative transcriptional regulator [Streptomyces ipomoeae]|uniref:BTAD domain-containing putative transcriptional regulator n=1 Tax=Streptomyces ipomoeae TaxID=103232 RepID=UPI00403D4C93
MRDGLRFGLLGPPVLYDAEGADAGVRPVGSGKVRALFVALLLEPGRIVSVDALKDVLWDAAPPPSAQASLQNHVTRLRRLLDDPERLRAIPPGYLLRVGEGELDVRVFESHVAAARAAHAERDWARTVREATAALALWRGTPLGGLPVADFGAQAFVQRLEEARLLLLEWRCDAELHLAQGFEATDALAALAPELAALVAEHPLREAFHRLLMLALHRTGRQAEALAVHRDLRARLLDELGVEPGPAVREAHLEVLREQGPQEAEPSATAAAEEPPRPAQLPPPPAHFTGREKVLVQLRQVLDMAAPPKGARGGIESAATAARARTTTTHPHPPNHTSPRAMGRPTAPKGTRTVTVISGMAGVGKSALALHLAHELADRFPDGQLYVNLHGATPGMTPLTPAQALASLLRDLGTDPRRIPEQPDEAAALLRSTLAPTRTLMVLDDAANAAQVRPLLPAGAGCAVIVTSRSPLAALDGAHRFPLAPLSDDESAALLRAASGRAAGLDATHPLVALTGRLPLALRVVAARLAARRAHTRRAGRSTGRHGRAVASPRIRRSERPPFPRRRPRGPARLRSHGRPRRRPHPPPHRRPRSAGVRCSPPGPPVRHRRTPHRGRPRPPRRRGPPGGDHLRPLRPPRPRTPLRPRTRRHERLRRGRGSRRGGRGHRGRRSEQGRRTGPALVCGAGPAEPAGVAPAGVRARRTAAYDGDGSGDHDGSGGHSGHGDDNRHGHGARPRGSAVRRAALRLRRGGLRLG